MTGILVGGMVLVVVNSLTVSIGGDNDEDDKNDDAVDNVNKNTDLVAEKEGGRKQLPSYDCCIAT